MTFGMNSRTGSLFRDYVTLGLPGLIFDVKIGTTHQKFQVWLKRPLESTSTPERILPLKSFRLLKFSKDNRETYRPLFLKIINCHANCLLS